jgi:hypothetical protein
MRQFGLADKCVYVGRQLSLLRKAAGLCPLQCSMELSCRCERAPALVLLLTASCGRDVMVCGDYTFGSWLCVLDKVAAAGGIHGCLQFVGRAACAERGFVLAIACLHHVC